MKVKMNKKIIMIFAFVFIVLAINNVSAVFNNTGCCEETKNGFFCQNVQEQECKGVWEPTSCDSTSYCKAGTCYESIEGTCSSNTPRIVCNKVLNGSWSAERPAACNLGCCVLGDQAAFVSLVRCKRLSGMLGLQTIFNKNMNNEVQCVLGVQNQDKGACVYELDFEDTCKFTTRAECTGVNGSVKGEFFKNKLCTDPELGTNCERTRDTICVPGKDEVYFRDSCGNAGNIYDASKIEDVEYWTNVKTKTDSCNSKSANSNSKTCGNCNYMLGSFCSDSKTAGTRPIYGSNICADLNCEKTANGQSYRHGESWCVYDDEGTTGKGDNAVGARFYKHICVNGEEILEQCADFKQEECIEDKIKTPYGDFNEAACRVNRWQDCLLQMNELDCKNTDKRDCLWKEDIKLNSSFEGTCVPKNTPGIKFWEGEDAKAICGQASVKCVVTFEEGLVSGEKCVKNCECLTTGWLNSRNDICKSLGDCGPKINWLGKIGYKTGYNYTIGKK